MLDHILAQVIAYRISVPVRGVQKALGALRIRLSRSLGELPTVLALYSVQQAEQVALCPMARLRTGEMAGDPPVQLLEPL